MVSMVMYAEAAQKLVYGFGQHTATIQLQDPEDFVF